MWKSSAQWYRCSSTESPGGGAGEGVLGGRQPVVKLEPLKTDPLKPVSFHIGMTAKQLLDACKSVFSFAIMFIHLHLVITSISIMYIHIIVGILHSNLTSLIVHF